MIRNAFFAPPAPPAGLDVRALRQWCVDAQHSLDSCVWALRTLEAALNRQKGGARGEEGGAGDPEPAAPTSYNTIGGTTEGNEAADSTTHTYDGSKGLYFYAMTRTAYYHAGDKKVYGYVRLVKFDKYGRLYSVGAETRVEIDATVT